MTTLPSWDDLIAGNNCPFCTEQPERSEYSVHVAHLGMSELRLSREQTYKGYCILVFTGRHVTGLEQLTKEEHATFMADMKKAGDAIYKAVSPDHMNYASLGNVVPHLHVHIIPRYIGDDRWGGPVWMTDASDMRYIPLENEEEYTALAARIREHLS